ncbi:hypothetical protein JIN77_05170 [Verrucomicrobiaceae bacterium R5-34]|uniref:Uncharacterized protein n=1 Tax=Oceaniferula flava TaxID=2800421 RepID=A0AAE2VC02_9BACT|nr:hypothetical protein [Oceaniferula flavus]MBK1830101.1 hypothetical protein [Verrucomicrobiaceae bacterium R5-34]MBK1855030.1 hypothetical protein [Oceaniferula flavus]MBM1136336.1 hypothetical protein [Oceaniferula flavus]
MLHWNKNPNRHVATDLNTLSDPPNGGVFKLVLLGVLLPGWIMYHASEAWLNESAIWYGQSTDVTLSGPAARAMAIVYGGVALFCHFRWFWGLQGYYRTWEIGTIVALLGFVGGLITALVLAFY